ncbi:MAG: helix-turn-helix domain-containing protein [Actinomycetota bacterium]|nr:helix-turn-helix domain-containing protein [Actinomycetota bacterium]
MPPHGEVTLGALLAEPALRAHLLVGGGDPSATPVDWCEPLAEALASGGSLERIAVFARAGELPGAHAELRELFTRLVAHRCPVVVVSGADGETRIGCADAAAGGAPAIVLVGAPVTYLELSRLVAEKNLAQDAHVLAYGVNVHRALSEVLYRGSGLATMAREISRLARCPTFLLDANGAVLAYESLGPGAVPDPSELVRLLAVELDAGGGEPGREADRRHARLAHVALEDQPVTVVTAPIVLGEHTYGWIVIVELEEPPAAHDVAQHRVIAEQGAMISGSEMLRLRSVEAAEERARGDFVHALLHGRFANVHELVARAAHHDFDLRARYAVVVVAGLLGVPSTRSLERQRALVRSIGDLPARSGQRTLTTTVGELLVVVREIAVVAGRGRGSLDQGAADVAAFARLLASTRLGEEVTVTFGRPGQGATGVHQSYREAQIALGISQRLHLDRVCGYSELRVFAALAAVADTPEGRDFANEVLEPLAQVGFGADLEQVATTYVAHGGNLNAAARELQLHRNTMLYKVERVSRLLGLDLRDPEARFTFWLAHRIRTLSEVSAAVDSEFGPGI